MVKKSKRKDPDKNASGRFVASEYDTSRGTIKNKKITDDLDKIVANLGKKRKR